MRTTQNRRTDENDLKLNLPEPFQTEIPNPKNDPKKDQSPLHFTSPLYQPLTKDHMVIVHPQGSSKTGGFFGMTRSQGKQVHRGVDLEAPIGTGVMAAEDGVVTFAGEADGYGKVIYLKHRNGYQTRYAHLSEISVKAGERVAQGHLIGASGKTGNADSPDIIAHLHFEILKKNDQGSYVAQDPVGFITTPDPNRKFRMILEGARSREGSAL